MGMGGEKIEYELACESQQSPNMTLIKGDIKKLANLPAKLKVLYCCGRNHNRIIKTITKMRAQYEDNQGKFLVIIDPWVGTDGFSEGTLRGVLLNKHGQIKGEGTAKIRLVVDGMYSIRMFLDTTWKYRSVSRKS